MAKIRIEDLDGNMVKEFEYDESDATWPDSAPPKVMIDNGSVFLHSYTDAPLDGSEPVTQVYIPVTWFHTNYTGGAGYERA